MLEKNTSVGLLVRIDHCLGCRACEAACREENGFSFDETWLEAIHRKPVIVEGSPRLYHVLAPQLDKCAFCLEKENTPLCLLVCPPKCLYIAERSTLLKLMEGEGSWQLTV